ncbi:MAG: pilus assembly protein [Acidobacteria bacterium]|nr:pilus assembly protein [Acidobacteriota bacterium]
MRDDRGVALVEFGLVAPILFLVLFAIVDFGWVFGQHLDVRHGVREGARLVSVNYSPLGDEGSAQTMALASNICGRMDPQGLTSIEISLKNAASSQVGDLAVVEVISEASPLTGFMPLIFEGMDLRSTIEVRLEADATWADGVGAVTCL